MKKLTILTVLMLISNLGKPDYTLRKRAISELKPVEYDYRNTVTSNVMYGLPQIWFWKK